MLSVGRGPAAWASEYVEGEVRRQPAVLFADLTGADSRAARRALEEARVHFGLVDVSSLGQPALPGARDGGRGVSWSALVLERLASISGGLGTPVLFLGGRPLGGPAEIADLTARGELRRRCAEAGAALFEVPEPASRLPWTPREDLRWLPPKDINGRRWYQDDPNSARHPEEHGDQARIEYNTDSVVPGAGTDHRGRFTGSAKALLRQQTNLDEPDGNGVRRPIAPFTDVNLVLQPDVGWTNYLWSRDLERAGSVGPEDVAREGLRRDQLIWVYSQGKKKLVDELALRQCRSKLLTTLDVQGLREALMEEMRKEHAFSPTQQGVVPGIVQSLSGRQLREERYADTDVPLLLAVLSGRSPACFHLRDRLQTAAKRALRAVRVVRVDGQRYPEVPRELGISRLPTLLWLRARTGAELAREVGVVPSATLVERTSAVLRAGGAPAPRGEDGALAVPTVRDEPRWRRNGGMLVEEGGLARRWASRRAIRNSA